MAAEGGNGGGGVKTTAGLGALCSNATSDLEKNNLFLFVLMKKCRVTTTEGCLQIHTLVD